MYTHTHTHGERSNNKEKKDIDLKENKRLTWMGAEGKRKLNRTIQSGNSKYVILMHLGIINSCSL